MLRARKETRGNFGWSPVTHKSVAIVRPGAAVGDVVIEQSIERVVSPLHLFLCNIITFTHQLVCLADWQSDQSNSVKESE